MQILKALFVMLAVTVIAMPSGMAADPPRGGITGGKSYELPDWFKKSFKFLKEDVEEATQQGRHLMLFMHLDECPYCARLLDENFRHGETREFTEKNFDVIGINIRSDNPVEWVDGNTYSERELAGNLKVKATPTMVFFDMTGKVVLQLNGYRKPAALRQALDYVHGKHYQTQTLAAYVEQQNKAAVYQFRKDPRFSEMANFKNYDKPLAVIFEDKDCVDCDEFHTKVMNHPEVLPELAKFKVVRLDAYSDAPIVDINGDKTTPKKWAQSLAIVYRPGIAMFNEGALRTRMDGMQFHFHFRELLRYVSGKYYHQYDTPSLYNAARREELLKQGVVIDYSQ
ncbi:MAG: thioredoxin fold domain-containing protein [Gammaproteobacteria bacterium]|nr:thioredoxin fold domain-containing protein [Gammaproteobacteria bacterium]